MSTARKNNTQQIGYLRFKVNYNDAASGVALNKQTLPKGAIIIGVVLAVTTAFNAATTNTLSIGTVGDTATNIVNAQSVSAAGVTNDLQPTTGGAAYGALAADKQIQVTYTQTGAAATAGAAYVVIMYVCDNDLNIGQ